MSDNALTAKRRAAVIGWPVAHSLSPLIHMTWASREGVDAHYMIAPAEPDEASFRRVADDLRRQGFRGANVTMPHKEHAVRYATQVSDAVRTTGAANMLTFDEAGVTAANSDATAIRKLILDLSVPPRTALVLGAGGAARAALWALSSIRPRVNVLVANRTRGRAEAIAAIGASEVIDWELRNVAAARADVIVNATSLGMTGEPPLEINDDALMAGAVAFDTVYRPLETPFLRAAKTKGLRTIDGLSMLMEQAAPGYLCWLGDKADIDDDLRARLVAALTAGAEA